MCVWSRHKNIPILWFQVGRFFPVGRRAYNIWYIYECLVGVLPNFTSPSHTTRSSITPTMYVCIWYSKLEIQNMNGSKNLFSPDPAHTVEFLYTYMYTYAVQHFRNQINTSSTYMYIYTILWNNIKDTSNHRPALPSSGAWLTGVKITPSPEGKTVSALTPAAGGVLLLTDSYYFLLFSHKHVRVIYIYETYIYIPDMYKYTYIYICIF